ncbi:hypothetical protein BN946_scf185010.g5 [Trametes cinnabarina]|uniref:SUN domain-containing protein n=1 Tax=Pycnoporus cinnabarinus TaxID=5643 RepID=A0A060SL00_PYCCI|nr:hypothetical protein BN946_scf185010.g5 [Trametes cinnabarina]
MALNEDLRIGSCWSVADAHAQLAVVIPQLFYPTHVTIDHVPLETTVDIGQAPRHLRLWGLLEDPVNRDVYYGIVSTEGARSAPPISAGHQYALLADFEYNIHAQFHIQTFPIDPRIIQSHIYFGLVVLEIVDNWGSTSTCLYRVRLHGSPVRV